MNLKEKVVQLIEEETANLKEHGAVYPPSDRGSRTFSTSEMSELRCMAYHRGYLNALKDVQKLLKGTDDNGTKTRDRKPEVGQGHKVKFRPKKVVLNSKHINHNRS